MIRGVPISVLQRSDRFLEIIDEFIASRLIFGSEIYIADFAAGENDEIPIYIHYALVPYLLSKRESIGFYVYCTDVHSLRIESLFEKIHSMKLTENTRIVHCKFEEMTENASFPKIQLDYLKFKESMTALDRSLIDGQRLLPNAFHIGFLNNDVVGYLHEYYKEYTDSNASLVAIRKVMKTEGLLIVTQPCLLYPLDNIKVLESYGFRFITGFDFDYDKDIFTEFDRTISFTVLSKLGHYTALLFRAI